MSEGLLNIDGVFSSERLTFIKILSPTDVEESRIDKAVSFVDLASQSGSKKSFSDIIASVEAELDSRVAQMGEYTWLT